MALVLGVAAPAGPGVAQTGPPDYDFDWVTIGSPENAGYDGPDPNGVLTGRGATSYAYRISRLEVTTAQWLEHVNTFSTQSDELFDFGRPLFWGAVIDPDYGGPGRRWTLNPDYPDAALQPVFGVNWRMGAVFCNWLHNDKSSDLGALQNGAYDASTFTNNHDGSFNDQLTHHPDARFWIPTWDEWLKAAHFDPDRHGPGEPGWWMYSHTSDVAPVSGPPGEGESSVGYYLPNFGHTRIPLGAYPDTVSPWGLLDLSGGVEEWTEEIFPGFGRTIDGTPAGSTDFNEDHIIFASTQSPWLQTFNGLRVVSAIPAPSALLMVSFWIVTLAAQRRRT